MNCGRSTKQLGRVSVATNSLLIDYSSPWDAFISRGGVVVAVVAIMSSSGPKNASTTPSTTDKHGVDQVLVPQFILRPSLVDSLVWWITLQAMICSSTSISPFLGLGMMINSELLDQSLINCLDESYASLTWLSCSTGPYDSFYYFSLIALLLWTICYAARQKALHCSSSYANRHNTYAINIPSIDHYVFRTFTIYLAECWFNSLSGLMLVTIK